VRDKLTPPAPLESYAKYKEFTTKHYGPDFRLFRKTVTNPDALRG